jgi:hypothetical protein
LITTIFKAGGFDMTATSHSDSFTAGRRDLLTGISVRAPTTYGALTVFPLVAGEDTPPPGYLVLDEALATGQFRITELSENGVVSTILAVNETASPVFLLDGEELTGAKQNRVLNLSLMLAAGSETQIPVSCVEAGRWRHESRGESRGESRSEDSRSFEAADRTLFARGRAAKTAQVTRSLCLSAGAFSDQGAIWDEISGKSSRMRVDSPTAAMAAMYDSRQDDMKAYTDAFPCRSDQTGAVYVIGSVIAGIEAFHSTRTFARLAPKLLASYALDAMECDGTPEPLPAAAVEGFIDAVRATPSRHFPAAGLGETIRLSGAEAVGAVLEVSGSGIHLSAFPRQAADDRDRAPEEIRLRPSRMRGRH